MRAGAGVGSQPWNRSTSYLVRTHVTIIEYSIRFAILDYAAAIRTRMIHGSRDGPSGNNRCLGQGERRTASTGVSGATLADRRSFWWHRQRPICTALQSARAPACVRSRSLRQHSTGLGPPLADGGFMCILAPLSSISARCGNSTTLGESCHPRARGGGLIASPAPGIPCAAAAPELEVDPEGRPSLRAPLLHAVQSDETHSAFAVGVRARRPSAAGCKMCMD